MQMKSRIFTALVVILLCSFSIASLVLIDLFGGPAKTVSVPVPTQADWVVRVDAASFWKQELYTILFDSKDERLLSSLQELMDKKLKGKGKKRPLYIDFESDLVLYGIHEDTHRFTVMLFQLKHPAKFKKNISDYLTARQSYAIQGNTGLILTQAEGAVMTKKHLQQLVHHYSKAHFIDFNKQRKSDKELITARIAHSGEDLGLRAIQLGISHDQQAITFSGSFTWDQAYQGTCSFDLQSSGFYMASRIVPQQLEDTLNALLPLGSYKFSGIESCILDYRGMYLEAEIQGLPSVFGYLPIPKINLIVSSKNDLSVDSIYRSCPPAIRGANHTLNFGETDYELVQLDAHTIFIGIDPTTVKKTPQRALTLLKGSLPTLTTIEGSSFVSAFVQNMGPIKIGNDFFATTRSFRLQIEETRKNNYAINGKMYFKEGKFPLNEVTKLLVSLKVIR